MHLPPSVQRQGGLAPADVSPEAEIAHLRRRLERERRSRQEAEAIAERGLRELFRRQQELLLIEAVAESASVAPAVNETMRFALQQFSEFSGWTVGHLCMRAPDTERPELVSTDVWHVSGEDRYASLRLATSSFRFGPGDCLPGRVLADNAPLFIRDLRSDPGFLRTDAVAVCGLRAAFALPIRVGPEVEAVLEFFTAEAPAPDEDLLRLAVHLGTLLGRVIERQRAAKRLIDAYQDPLTRLPNRALLLDELDLALRHCAQYPGFQIAVLFLDLDRFKVINDSLGHQAGDRMIVEFSRRITRCVRRPDREPPKPGFPAQRADTVARLGGDEFVVLLDDINDVSDAVRVAERILRALDEPFDLEGQQVLTSASIGIAVSATGYAGAQDIVRDADSAMYRAKASGKARYAIFDPTMHERAVARLQTEADLRHAIEREEFRLHFQPVVSLRDNRLVMFEALLRWEHPDRGLLYPADFIPVAEETGLIQSMGRWALRTACTQTKAWQEQFGFEALSIAVNLSAREFAHPDLAPFIEEMLRTTGLTPARLIIELTESVAMEDVDHSAHTLEELKNLGVRIAIDDFGTGFSSLSYLHRLPVDALKIDRSFVSRLRDDPASREIIRAIIALATALDVQVIAEGIETAVDLAQLRDLGSEFGQGYFIARPHHAEAAAAMIERSVTAP